MIEYFKRMFSNMSERASNTDSSKKFLTDDVLQALLTKLKSTFIKVSQLNDLKKRIGQLEKKVSELESALEDAIYYKEQIDFCSFLVIKNTNKDWW